MVFVITNKLETGENILQVIGGQLSDNGIDNIYSAQDMLGNSAVFSQFRQEADLKVAVLPGSKVLSIICLSDGYTGVTTVYNLVDNYLSQHNLETLPTDVSQKLIEKLMSMNLDRNTAVCIITFCMTHRMYLQSDKLTGTVNIGLDAYHPDYFDATKEFIDSMNQQSVWPFTQISISENVTKYQNSPEDELFIEIPARQMLLDESVNAKSLIPKKSQLFNPYGAATLDDMTTYKDPGVKFPQDLYPDVEGYVHNNELEIQENEQKYYQSLIEWVKFNMKSEAVGDVDLSTSNPNLDSISQYYLSSLCEMLYSWNWDHNPNIPEYDEEKEEQDYITESEEDSIKSSYVHRATRREQEAIAAGMVDLTDLREKHINAIEILQDFLREASLNLGYGVYVEAVIKLARWGSRKPTMLFFNDYPLVFDLGTNTIKQYIGYIDNYELQQTNDCDASALCAIYDNTIFADKQYLRRLSYSYDKLLAPIGVIGKKVFVNKTQNGPETLEFEVYYSIIDIVRSYVTGTDEFKLDGITYEDGKFVCTKEIVCDNTITLSKLAANYANNRNNRMLNPFCTSDTLQNLYLDFNVVLGPADAPLHHFSILQSKQRVNDLQKDITLQKFESKEDLQAKRERREIRLLKYAVETGVASVILPVFIKASVKVTELDNQQYDLADILNIYKDVMLQENYNDEASFMSAYSRKVNVVSLREAAGYTESSSNVSNMNLFGESKTEEDSSKVTEKVEKNTETVSVSTEKVENTEETKEESTGVDAVSDVPLQPRVSFVKAVESSDKYYRLQDKSGNVVGGCAIRTVNITRGNKTKPLTIYIFVDDKTISAVPNDKIVKDHMFKNVVPLMVNDLYHYQKRSYEFISAFFKDEATLDYYRYKIKELISSNSL